MDSENQQQIKETTKDEQTTSPFDHLPYETLIDILSRLPITSLTQFTLLSKSLNSLPRDPYLIAAHLSRSPTNASSCLILHSDYPIRNRLHFLRLPDRTVRRIDPPFAAWMPEFTIVGSSDGLLCLVNTLFPESVYLYNPFTGRCSELPKNRNFRSHATVYGFGFRCNECKVIEIACRVGVGVSDVEVYSLSSNTWRNKGELPFRLEDWSSPGVLVSGRLHWVSQRGQFNGRIQSVLVSFDLVDESFRTINNPGSDFDNHSVGRWVRCHLAALDGRLCAAVVLPPGHGAFDIWVMKEYGMEDSWTKEYAIGVYTPVSMISHKMETSSHIWRNMFGRKMVRVLCVLESGEVVLEYRGGGLVSYDVQNECFKELVFPGMPELYQTLLHVGSLKSVVILPS